MVASTEILGRYGGCSGSSAVAEGIDEGFDARGGGVGGNGGSAHGVYGSLHSQLAYIEAGLLKSGDESEMRSTLQKRQVQAYVAAAEYSDII